VGEDDHPGEESPLHAAIKFSVEIGLLVDVERLAGLLDDTRVAILPEVEKLAEVVDGLVEREARAHLLDLDAHRMALGLFEEGAGERDELVELAAGAQLRINRGIDGVDADAQPLQRRREQLRPHLLGQYHPVRADAGLGKESNRVVDARVQQRLAHLVQPFEAQPHAVDLALGALDQRPLHVLVRTAQHRQRAHAAAQVAPGGQLEADFESPRIELHLPVTKASNTFAYSGQEYIRAVAAAARSIAARSRAVKNSSTAFASAAGSSGGMRMPFWPSMISGSPPMRVAITGRAK